MEPEPPAAPERFTARGQGAPPDSPQSAVLGLLDPLVLAVGVFRQFVPPLSQRRANDRYSSLGEDRKQLEPAPGRARTPTRLRRPSSKSRTPKHRPWYSYFRHRRTEGANASRSQYSNFGAAQGARAVPCPGRLPKLGPAAPISGPIGPAVKGVSCPSSLCNLCPSASFGVRVPVPGSGSVGLSAGQATPPCRAR